MNIEVPKTIQVGGFGVTVDFVNHDMDLHSRRRYGESDFVVKLIKVESRYSPEQTSQTFIHELLHQVDDIYNNDALGDECIDRLAQGLWQVFKQLGINFVQEAK